MIFGGCVTERPQNMGMIPSLPPIEQASPMKKMLSFPKLRSVGTTNILANCVTTPGKTAVTLAWCPSPSTTNNEVAGYKIYYGGGAITNWTPDIYDTNQPPCPSVIVQSGSNWFRAYTNSVVVGNILTATINNLTSGATYYFSATAYDTNNLESDFSNEISYTMPLPVTNPLTNAVLTIVQLGSGTIQLQSKICPNELATIWYTRNFNQAWSVLASNVVADVYGNLFYIESSTNDMRFYKLQIQ